MCDQKESAQRTARRLQRDLSREQRNQPSPAAEPSVGELLNIPLCRNMLIEAYRNGYECGHNDTVESSYGDAKDSAEDWLMDAAKDGSFDDI